MAYCCPGPQGVQENPPCSPARFQIPRTLFSDGEKKQYAIVTLLMMGDSYLPGALMLARSLREASPRLSSEVDLVCMVTADVSAVARADLATEFDRVDAVDYIEHPPERIRHRSPAVRKVYAKTFTKLRCMGPAYSRYRKVLLMDADMLVPSGRPEIFSLFELEPPAAVFFGCLRPFFPAQFADHVATYCPHLRHGELVPRHLFTDKRCAAVNRSPIQTKTKKEGNKRIYVGMETSIVLLEPNASDLASMQQVLARDAAASKTQAWINGDTALLSKHYEGRWRHVDMRFLGRWTDPVERPEVFTIDLYGSEGKPWDVAAKPELRRYPDIAYWLSTYKKAYKRRFSKTCKHPLIVVDFNRR